MTVQRVTKRQMPAAWHKQYRLDRELGRPRQVPVDRTRAHVEQLLGAGWTLRAIAEASGLSSSALDNVLHRNHLVRVTTARALLALKPRAILDRANPAGFVPALGARRRIRAMMALGWTHAHMKEQSGIRTALVLNQRGDLIARATHDAIDVMYEALCMTLGPSERTRTRAAAAGYAPPLAWDDIDDPDEQPNLNQEVPRPGGRAEASLDEWVHLVLSGEDHARAAARVGVSLVTVEKYAYRHGRADVMRLLGIVHARAKQVSAA